MDAIEQLKTLRLSEHSQRGYGYPEAQIYHGENEVALDMAIEALEWQKRFDDEMYISKDYHDKVYAELQKRYFDLLVPERTRWIPVSDRLPDDRTSILVYHNISGLTDEAWFYKHIRHPLHEYDIDDQYWSDVTHWMPLPEPPEQEV